MENTQPDWSALAGFRDQIRRKYHDVWDIPLVKRRKEVLGGVVKDGMTVLDIGAGTKDVEKEIASLGLKTTYKSMDIDATHYHDFHDLDEIHGTFDVITVFEVLEHLLLPEAFSMLATLKTLTKKNGSIILSTPNVFNPTRFFQDVTHRTAIPYFDLCALLQAAGFEIDQVFRSYHDPVHRYIVKRYLLSPFFKLFTLDYAYSIFVVARPR